MVHITWNIPTSSWHFSSHKQVSNARSPMTVRYYARAALLQVRARRAAEEMIDLQPKKDADVW